MKKEISVRLQFGSEFVSREQFLRALEAMIHVSREIQTPFLLLFVGVTPSRRGLFTSDQRTRILHELVRKMPPTGGAAWFNKKAIRIVLGGVNRDQAGILGEEMAGELRKLIQTITQKSVRMGTLRGSFYPGRGTVTVESMMSQVFGRDNR